MIEVRFSDQIFDFIRLQSSDKVSVSALKKVVFVAEFLHLVFADVGNARIDRPRISFAVRVLVAATSVTRSPSELPLSNSFNSFVTFSSIMPLYTVGDQPRHFAAAYLFHTLREDIRRAVVFV